MRVAVIDDDPEILTWFIHYLKKEGHEVVTALDGDSGYQLMVDHEPDVALVDLQMPTMDGLAMTK